MPEESTHNVPVSAPVAPATKLQIKDLLIPIAIVVAGLAVGAGLYFSAGDAAKVTGTTEGTAAAKVADTTNKIDPVTEADHIKGNLDAKVKIVEYSDFECPFCKRNHETLNAVIAKYDPSEVAWVYRQFPLEQLHPVKAMAVAMASECVGEIAGNDVFWKFTDAYFKETLTNNRTDIETVIPKIVSAIGVDQAKFVECFESKRHQAAIEADIADAVETGGRGTPWGIMIGPTGKTYPINGAQSMPVIEQMIATALTEA